jgi:hypothetical protein
MTPEEQYRMMQMQSQMQQRPAESFNIGASPITVPMGQSQQYNSTIANDVTGVGEQLGRAMLAKAAKDAKANGNIDQAKKLEQYALLQGLK